MNANYDLLRTTLAVIFTLGFYSVLYRENKFYRFCEHVFIGLAVGWTLVAMWTETLYTDWWLPMVGKQPSAANAAGTPGHWLYAAIVPISLMGYFVFTKKHNWMSRIPIGIIIGLWSGQQVQAFANQYAPQIESSAKPIFPNTRAFFATTSQPAGQVTVSQAVNNLLFIITIVAVLAYFLYSFDVKSKLVTRTALLGRWLLMIGFGAIFGSTVMMRFTLLIDRMYFIWIEWLKNGVLPHL